jgi:glycine/D-amino acid oxidase-like deaminating enzyme
VKFVRGLAAVAEREFGLVVFEKTPATSMGSDVVTTPEGRIRAKHVIHALETGEPHLKRDEEVANRELALVTEPFSDQDLAQGGWDIGGMLWTTGSDYLVARKVGNRIFLNVDLPLHPAESDLDEAQAGAVREFGILFPDFPIGKLKVSHRWAGLLLYPERYRPSIVPRGNGFEIYGCGGNGLTNGIMLGQLVAEALQGKEIPEAYRAS